MSEQEHKEIAFIGIDPGSKGSICILAPLTKEIHFIDTSSNPIEIVEELNKYKELYTIVMGMIEDVHSIYGTSAKSNFNFGYNTGLITGIVKATAIGLDKVQPKLWQKHFHIKTKGKEIKKEVASICNDLYPSCAIYGARGGLLDGRSDALLVATYCAYKYYIGEKK